jgi:predicted site-specific integrase-resolvase
MNDYRKTNYVPIRDAVQITGLSPGTLRKMADNNKLKYYRTIHQQRMFDKSSLQTLINPLFVDDKEQKTYDKFNYIYARVSSKKQLEDLHRQVEFLQSRKPEYVNYTVITDVGSGINFKRKGLQTILDSCLQGTIGEVVVAHRDRLARFGFELLRYIVETAGGKITVIDDQRNKSSEQELSEDLLSIIHVYSCKQMGKRSYRSRNESSENTIENKQV